MLNWKFQPSALASSVSTSPQFSCLHELKVARTSSLSTSPFVLFSHRRNFRNNRTKHTTVPLRLWEAGATKQTQRELWFQIFEISEIWPPLWHFIVEFEGPPVVFIFRDPVFWNEHVPKRSKTTCFGMRVRILHYLPPPSHECPVPCAILLHIQKNGPLMGFPIN